MYANIDQNTIHHGHDIMHKIINAYDLTFMARLLIHNYLNVPLLSLSENQLPEQNETKNEKNDMVYV